MERILEKIRESADFLKNLGFSDISVGVVLGTGLGAFAGLVTVDVSIPYDQIPHFPVATVEFHSGKLILGKIGNVKLVVMQGRFHYYEGYSMQQITFPVRVMKEMGIRFLFLSNAAGGVNLDLKKADLVLIEDHINLLPENPLRGLNDSAFGNRFVDMSAPYSAHLNNQLIESAQALGIPLKKGVYASVMGPNLETRAEYRYLKTIGADIVGMSTVPEVIVAGHIGLACAAISVVTDECDPNHLSPVKIEEIIEVAGRADVVLSRLFMDTIKKI